MKKMENSKDNLLNSLQILINNNKDIIDDETKQHAVRFINKLDKYGLINNSLELSVLSDGNLTFKWSYTKPKNASFNIDFDKSTDSLVWCCYIDGIIDNLFGKVIHLEDILPYLKKFNGIQ